MMEENKDIVQSNDETETVNTTTDVYRVANQIAKRYCKDMEKIGVPVFTAYYVPGKGYRYKAVFPEEIASEQVKSEYKKFNEFLKVCIGFDKKDYLF